MNNFISLDRIGTSAGGGITAPAGNNPGNPWGRWGQWGADNQGNRMPAPNDAGPNPGWGRPPQASDPSTTIAASPAGMPSLMPSPSSQQPLGGTAAPSNRAAAFDGSWLSGRQPGWQQRLPGWARPFASVAGGMRSGNANFWNNITQLGARGW